MQKTRKGRRGSDDKSNILRFPFLRTAGKTAEKHGEPEGIVRGDSAEEAEWARKSIRKLMTRKRYVEAANLAKAHGMVEEGKAAAKKLIRRLMKDEHAPIALCVAEEFGLVFEERQTQVKTIAQAEKVLERLVRGGYFDLVELLLMFYEFMRRKGFRSGQEMRPLKLGEIAKRVADELAANGDEIGAERIRREYGIAQPKMQ